MARARTRNESRKQQSQRRQPSARNARAARNRRADLRDKRRRGAADEGMVAAAIGGTPRREAKSRRPRKDPNNRTRSKRVAPRVAAGKGGRPRSPRRRERRARRSS